MLHEEKKVAKIVEELTMFFFTIESTNMNSSILKLNNEAVITFHANYNPKYEYRRNYVQVKWYYLDKVLNDIV